MKMIKLNIILDNKMDVFREIEISEDKNLQDLHHWIVSAFDLEEEEMASFYMTDDDWNQEDEIPLVGMEDNSMEMNSIEVGSIFNSMDSKLLYTQDFLLLWRFMVNVENIREQVKGDETNITLSFGDMPKEAPEVLYVSENEDEDEDGSGEFDEFDEYNEY
jgi:hypothetical protein